MNFGQRVFYAFLAAFLVANSAAAQKDSAVRVLVVTAHADDHGAFAATIYQIAHASIGTVDLAVITNGEAGYKYSTLAESYYGLHLTDPAVGRQYLPGIRKAEAMAGGRILGIRNYFFLDERDKAYTLSADTVQRFHWNLPTVKSRLQQIVTSGDYDYILCLLPTEDTHGAHKAATIAALETVRDLPPNTKRPIILGENDSTIGKPMAKFSGLSRYPVTAVKSGGAALFFDRTKKFGYNNTLDYKIVVNWMIAEHKSQGTMQLLMNVGDIESFWFFDVNDSKSLPAVERLFERLKTR